MSCWNITEIIRRARTVGIIIELDETGNLRLRAPNEPPQAMVQHLREHKQELVAFLRAKAEAQDGESRIIASQQKRTLRRRDNSTPIGKTVREAVPVLATPSSRRNK
ncbi:MAG: hypothetical protein ACXW3S_14450 [Rhodoplanes sp.]